LIGGFDLHGVPHIYTTDPSGSVSEWKANSIGRNSKQVSEFLEKNYKEDLASLDATKLAIRSLLDVVESGNKNIELVVVTAGAVKHLTDTEIEEIVVSLKE
jgi:20S proteasome subunit alpha 4